MTASISPLPRLQYVDANGNPMSGGKLFIYSAGTNTKVNSFTTSDLTITNTNPIILDSLGMTPSGIWFDSTTSIKVVLAPSTDTDPPTSPIYTEDNITASNSTNNLDNMWVRQTSSPTYLSTSSFSVVGDQTESYAVNNRVKLLCSSGYIYATVKSSSYSPDATTVVVVPDSLSLDSGLSEVSLSTISYSNTALPEYYQDIVDNKNLGWNKVEGETWTYASASDSLSTYTFTVPSDVTSKYSEGMKVKFNQVLSAPLTSYFTMDTDGSDSVGTASVTNTATTFTSGKFGNAATFNGATSKLVIADNATLKPTGDFTVGMWVKTASSVVQVLFQCFSNNTVLACGGYQLQTTSNGNVALAIGDNTVVSASSGNGYSFLRGNRAINDNAFHYVVVTYRNNIIQIYIDGELDSYGYSRSPVYPATVYTNIGVGNNTAVATAFFTGQIDDVFFINGIALDGETIKAKYLANEAQTNNSLTITKYGFISATPTYSNPNSTVTVYLGCDYKLTNTTIYNPYISNLKSPFKFPLKEIKFTQVKPLETTVTQAAPVAATWYNLGSQSLQVGVGSWNIGYKTLAQYINGVAVATNLYTTLSTINGIETHKQLTNVVSPTNGTATQLFLPVYINSFVQNPITTTYYLLTQSSVAGTSINNYGVQAQGYIRAVSAYL